MLIVARKGGLQGLIASPSGLVVADDGEVGGCEEVMVSYQLDPLARLGICEEALKGDAMV
ncbi:hypothetical protein [Rhizobium johnstonii]|uniref:hypothetical protein n=1 Tax=Rhizobium johnstonii TaxID=3019933 RepID=UPI003F97E4C7